MKYCKSCGQMLDDTDLFCRTCGDKQPEIIKQEDPQVVTYQNEFVAETNQNPKKKSKKKIIIPSIIIATLAIAAVVIYIVFFSDSTKAKKGLGIFVKGEYYEFTVEDGIKDYDKIEDGVAYSTKDGLKFAPNGSDEKISITQPELATWIQSIDEREAYGEDACMVEIYFREDYKIDGLDGKATRSDLEDAGYVDNYMLATEKGNIDLSEYDDDLEKIRETKTFHCIPYFDQLVALDTIFSDYILDDDVEGFLEELEEMEERSSTDDGYWERQFERQMCLADLLTDYNNGEVGIVIVKHIVLTPEDRDDVDNLLIITIIGDYDNLNKWREDWGFDN